MIKNGHTPPRQQAGHEVGEKPEPETGRQQRQAKRLSVEEQGKNVLHFMAVADLVGNQGPGKRRA